MTTGETIVFDDDLGTFHEVETPTNIQKKKCRGTVPDDQRDRAGGKAKDKDKNKQKCEFLKPIKSDAGVQTMDSCESIKSEEQQGCEQQAVLECMPVKKEVPPKKTVSYEDKVRCCTYPAPELKEDEREASWEREDFNYDGSSSEEDDVPRYRTESECEIEDRMLPLMKKYGVSYISRKILIIGKKIENENALLKQKKSSKQVRRESVGSMEFKGILKKSRMEPTPFEITSPVKCPHCKKNNIINLECKSGPGRPCSHQLQRQFRR